MSVKRIDIKDLLQYEEIMEVQKRINQRAQQNPHYYERLTFDQ